MRRVLFAALFVAAGACGHSKAPGPAWPAPSTTADDGGESIAPHETSTIAAAIEKSVDPAEKKDEPAVTPAAVATDTTEKPAEKPKTTSQPVVDDVIMSEEIIIEIDD